MRKETLYSLYLFPATLIILSKLTNIEITKTFFIILFILNINKIKNNKFIYKFIIFFNIIIAILYFEIDKLNYIYLDFLNIIVVILGAILITSYKLDFKILKKKMKTISYINILITSFYVFLNCENLRKSELGYMNIGYYYMYSNMYLMYCCYFEKNKKIKYINFIVIFLTMILQSLYGNRFSILISFVWGVYLISKKIKRKAKIILAILITLLIVYFKNLLSILVITFNIKTIGILRMYYSLNNLKNISQIFSGRIEIYKELINVIKNHPFGIGIYGYLDYTNQPLGFYPHNIFLEMTLQFGIVGILLLISYIIYVLIKINTIKNIELKYFYKLFLFYNLSLLLSGTYLKNTYFWTLFFIIFYKKNIYIKKYLNQKKKS